MREGNSLILTLIKSVSGEENRFKRINVQKIVPLAEVVKKPITEVTFNLKSRKELDEISRILTNEGSTLVNINISDENNSLSIRLNNKRNLDRKMLNILRNKEISSIIH